MWGLAQVCITVCNCYCCCTRGQLKFYKRVIDSHVTKNVLFLKLIRTIVFNNNDGTNHSDDKFKIGQIGFVDQRCPCGVNGASSWFPDRAAAEIEQIRGWDPHGAGGTKAGRRGEGGKASAVQAKGGAVWQLKGKFHSTPRLCLLQNHERRTCIQFTPVPDRGQSRRSIVVFAILLVTLKSANRFLIILRSSFQLGAGEKSMIGRVVFFDFYRGAIFF